MSKNDHIRREFLDKYQKARGGFHFAMDDDTDELICIWNFGTVARDWIESIASEYDLQHSNEAKGVWRLWW